MIEKLFIAKTIATILIERLFYVNTIEIKLLRKAAKIRGMRIISFKPNNLNFYADDTPRYSEAYIKGLVGYKIYKVIGDILLMKDLIDTWRTKICVN